MFPTLQIDYKENCVSRMITLTEALYLLFLARCVMFWDNMSSITTRDWKGFPILAIIIQMLKMIYVKSRCMVRNANCCNASPYKKKTKVFFLVFIFNSQYMTSSDLINIPFCHLSIYEYNDYVLFSYLRSNIVERKKISFCVSRKTNCFFINQSIWY